MAKKLTTYGSRQLKPLTKAALVTLIQDLNGDVELTAKGYGIAILNEKSDTYEVLASFATKDAAKRVRRILRSIMHKSFDTVYTLNVIPAKECE